MGLSFRKSKRMEDPDTRAIAIWGSTVSGFDGGDGWLMVAHRLGPRFLPFEYNGVCVLAPKGPPASPAKASAASPPSAKASAGGPLARTYSGQRLFTPKSPAVDQLQRTASAESAQDTSTPLLGLKRLPSFRSAAVPGEPIAKYARPDPDEAREFDLQTVVVSFGSVGGDFATMVMGKSAERGDKVFDWEGVRRAVRHLRCERGLQVIGVVFEHWWGQDRGRGSVGLPLDVRVLCSSVLETPRLTGEKHKVAEKEMAIKCAWRRNCRLVVSDDWDWRELMGDEKCRAWLESSQDVLQLRYFFEGVVGKFTVLE